MQHICHLLVQLPSLWYMQLNYLIFLYNLLAYDYFVIRNIWWMQQGNKRMPGTAVTKSVVANEPGGRKREEIFVDIIEKISLTFSSSVSIIMCVTLFISASLHLLLCLTYYYILYMNEFFYHHVLYYSEFLYVTSFWPQQGYILTSEIDVTIQMKSYLSGNPEIRLALNEDLIIGRGGRSVYGMLSN